MKLIPDQFKAKTDWFKIKAQTKEKSVIEIVGPIDSWYGVDPNVLVKQILALDAPAIDVYINSPGGDVFGAVAVYNALRSYNGTVRTFNMGLAASAAAIIFMAGEKRYMIPESMVMIHNAWVFTAGNRADHMANVNVLAKIDDLQARIFAKNSNVPQAQIEAMLTAETWLNTTDAIERGMAAEWDGPIPKDIPMAAFDLSLFENVPEKVKTIQNEIKEKNNDSKKDLELKLVRAKMENRFILMQGA